MIRAKQAGGVTWLIAVVGAASLALTLGIGSLLAAPTRGPVPSQAFAERTGAINRAAVPDYIPALAGDDQVGWVAKEFAIPEGDIDRTIIPVFADDLSTLVGHFVAGHGYAPLGTDLDALVGTLPAQPDLEVPSH